MKFRGDIRGLDDVNDVLTQITPKHAEAIMRATVHDISGQLVKDAKRNSPVDEGDLVGAIKNKRRRKRNGFLRSDVIVQWFAYYWRYLEYGQGPDGEEHAMFLKALQRMKPNLENVFLASFGKKLVARLRRERKKNGG